MTIERERINLKFWESGSVFSLIATIAFAIDQSVRSDMPAIRI